jgi:hypothetical protein
MIDILFYKLIFNLLIFLFFMNYPNPKVKLFRLVNAANDLLKAITPSFPILLFL